MRNLWSSIVLLKGHVPSLTTDEGQHVRSNNVLQVAVCIQIASNNDQGCPAMGWDATLHHHTPTIKRRSRSNACILDVVFTQTVTHSPGEYMAQPWNGSCSDPSRLEAIAQVRQPDVLVLPLWRHMWTLRPWSVTSNSCGLKTSQRELMVFRCTPNRRATSHWGDQLEPYLWLDDEHQSPNVACCLCAQTVITSKKMCFSVTSKHSQHPCIHVNSMWLRQRIRNGLFTTIVKRGQSISETDMKLITNRLSISGEHHCKVWLRRNQRK